MLSPDVEMGEQRVVLEDHVDGPFVGRVAWSRRGRGAGSGRRSGSSNPPIIRSVVVLPQPDGPSSEKNSPRGLDQERHPVHGHESLAESLLEVDQPDLGRGGLRGQSPSGRRYAGRTAVRADQSCRLGHGTLR